MTASAINKETIIKFDVPGPRYTSYPTAPVWTPEVGPQEYTRALAEFGSNAKTLSLYLHIPFCESLCYFCACHMMIRRKNDRYGDEYVEFLSREMAMVAKAIGEKKSVKQLHWGGGTPTYLNEEQIKRLFQRTQEHFDIDLDGEVAIEIDPRTIDRSKLTALRRLGFNRISLGVQDFDHNVQESINRIQPLEMVERCVTWSRELGFHSVNFDLIYGLPMQTKASFKMTMEQVIRLKPDRIALYSFAYLPWVKKHQTKVEAPVMPSNDEKMDIFLQSREALLGNGYQAIAMDHFALTTDEMAKAFNTGRLYRNFMGYTVKPADEYIGLGVSAIGFLENRFFQNHKVLADYTSALDQNKFPTERGMVLAEDDRIRQWVIGSLMCRFEVNKRTFQERFNKDFNDYFRDEAEHIRRCQTDQLIHETAEAIRVTELGKLFIRNVCMGFDWYLRQKNAHTKFSRTV